MTATKLERIDKAARLLIDGRLIVHRIEGEHIYATCRGDTGRVYQLQYENGHWLCGCEARSTCAHLRALWLVTVER